MGPTGPIGARNSAHIGPTNTRGAQNDDLALSNGAVLRANMTSHDGTKGPPRAQRCKPPARFLAPTCSRRSGHRERDRARTRVAASSSSWLEAAAAAVAAQWPPGDRTNKRPTRSRAELSRAGIFHWGQRRHLIPRQRAPARDARRQSRGGGRSICWPDDVPICSTRWRAATCFAREPLANH